MIAVLSKTMRATAIRARGIQAQPALRSLHLDSLAFPVHKFTPHATLRHELNAADAKAVHTPNPAVIVLQEYWGVDEQIKAHAQRIANQTGAVALVPDLYKGKLALDEAEATHLMHDLDWKTTLLHLADLVVAISESSETHTKRKVASLGFCMGGAMSLSLAAHMSKIQKPLNDSDRFCVCICWLRGCWCWRRYILEACVAFYGTPPESFIDVSDIPILTPVQAHFGEKDEYKGLSDADTARALEAKWAASIRKHGGTHAKGLHSLEERVFIYPNVGHAFMNDVRKKPDYDHELVNKVWRTVDDFLVKHLKTV
eukprot:jgi/Hompol1/611/HPOL_005384-RA